MIWLRHFLTLLLVGFALRPARAQLTQSVRLEIPSDPAQAEAFDVIPLARQGVLVTIRTEESVGNMATLFSFKKYNADLGLVWQTIFKQALKYRTVMTYHDDRFLYHLCREQDTNRFQFVRLQLHDGTIESFEGGLLDQFDIHQFKVLGAQAYVGGYHHNRPVVMAFSFFDGTAKVLPGMYVNHMEISSLEIDQARSEVNVLVHSSKRHCRFSIRTYNYDCRLLRTVDFDGAKNSLISGKLLPVNDHESLLVGNYSTDCTPYSQGIYVTRIQHGDSTLDASAEAVRSIQYVEFSQLQNFFNYLKPHRQQKLLAKAKKKKESGKDYKFRYRLLVHDLQPTANGLTLVAEVYYPQYRGTNLAYGGYLRGIDRYEGFRYTHAFVCGFDRSGNLLWDNCLPIKELLSSDLTEKVQLSQQADRIVLAYPNDGAISTEVIQGSRVLRETETIKLKTGNEQERITFSAQDNLMAWYDGHFLACGFQKISSANALAIQREVFYLNKLTYRAESTVEKPTGAPRKNNEPDR